ncbi:YhgE/Pip-like protein [Fontibacillus solani]|uniref:YhgE/Pip-like protein n=1 Tax=Fontibacillus solani TaxID=1572857 RepID=A0A7W3SP26_9BACL|nr:ABC transporter permease [Fontibacillus solani]MBA9083611.1 YhgE/Pip-like protein [Fontibacillus solani]
MFKGIKSFFKSPQSIVGIIIALMFQVIFTLIWMTAYDGVNDRVDQMKIAVVNEDQGFGKSIVSGLKDRLPFELVNVSTEEGQIMLENREVQLMLSIPADFSQKLQTSGDKAMLNYTINGSNPAMVKNMMESVVAGVTESINKQTTEQGTSQLLLGLSMPAEQVEVIAKEITGKVESNVDTIHPVDGMNNQMVPMMLVLASFVGTMIMSMNLYQASLSIRSETSLWQRFGARSLINLTSSLLISLIGTSLVFVLGGQMEHGFIVFWMFQALFVATFLFFSQMFLALFGVAGMLFNIAMLSLQLVTSGALVPRFLLNDFYRSFGEVLPATYAVEGLMNLQFGGSIETANVYWLIGIGIISLIIGLVSELARNYRSVRVEMVS